jgi:hypothetical protein
MKTNRMLKSKLFLLAGFSVLVCVGTTPALAGFEWHPPAAASQVSTQEGPAVPAQKVQSIEAVPLLTEAEKKKMPAPAAADIVSGFGNDLPLSVALQQVVPPEYKVSLAPGVSGDTQVSWHGDKPWKQVLADMLTAEGLGSSFRGKSITVASLIDAKKPAPPAVVSSKADMIPADMISDGGKNNSAKKDSSPAPLLAEKTPAPVPVVDVLPEAAPSVMPPVESAWQASKGQMLREVLDDWSKTAHVQLRWSTDYDYRLKDSVAYGGNYDSAVGRLFDQFSRANPQPYGQLHRTPDGGSVLIVNNYDTP